VLLGAASDGEGQLGRGSGRREGGAVLLVHGLGGGTDEVQRLAEALHSRLGLTVRALILPGHTPSGRWMPHSRNEDWVAAVKAGVEALGPPPVHLVGFSAGAMVALRVAELLALSGKLVLLAPFGDIYQPRLLPLRPEALLDGFAWLSQVPRRPPPLRDAALCADVARCLPFTTMNLDAARSAKVLSRLVLTDLSRVTAPTLLLQGGPRTPWWIQPARYASIRGCRHPSAWSCWRTRITW
jgi:pimeloyl-ACP methyl ester carboxylesterase